MKRFTDRADAGRQLSARVGELPGLGGCVVVGLPRGGVPVAFEVARALMSPLDVLVVRKVGVPSQPELAMGAIGEGAVEVIDERMMKSTNVSIGEYEVVATRERSELERRVLKYRGRDDPAPIAGKLVIIVDDGVATGSTARAALRVAKARGASRLVLAVPVISGGALQSLRGEVDDVVALVVVDGPFAVGEWYEHFDQTSDEEVMRCLSRAKNFVASSPQEETGRRGDAPRGAE